MKRKVKINHRRLIRISLFNFFNSKEQENGAAEPTKVRTIKVKFNSKVEDNETAPVKAKAEITAPIKGLLKKRAEPSKANGIKVASATNGADKKPANGKKAKFEEKITEINSKKRKLEKLQLDLEQSDEESDDDIAKHIFR
jgi:hypothetical protein